MAIGLRGSGPVSFWCVPTESVQRRLPLSARRANALPPLVALRTISVSWPSITAFVTIAGIITS